LQEESREDYGQGFWETDSEKIEKLQELYSLNECELEEM
jgi:hypothetical protein